MCHTACSLGQPAIQLGVGAGGKEGGCSCKDWVHLESKGILSSPYLMLEQEESHLKALGIPLLCTNSWQRKKCSRICWEVERHTSPLASFSLFASLALRRIAKPFAVAPSKDLQYAEFQHQLLPWLEAVPLMPCSHFKCGVVGWGLQPLKAAILRGTSIISGGTWISPIHLRMIKSFPWRKRLLRKMHSITLYRLRPLPSPDLACARFHSPNLQVYPSLELVTVFQEDEHNEPKA